LNSVALGRVVAQGIFAQQPVRRLDLDMRAGGKFRQRLAAGVTDFQHMDAVGDPLVARHAQRHHLRLVTYGHFVSGKALCETQ
jgi:hypothetical protein